MGAFGSSLLVTLNAGMPASSSMTCTRKKKIPVISPPSKKIGSHYGTGHSKGSAFGSRVEAQELRAHKGDRFRL
jgi:hypothetical protein